MQHDPMSDAELEALLAEPPKWPKVVGVLSIVFGVLAFTCTGIGAGWTAYAPTFMESMAQSQGVPTPPMPTITPGLMAAFALGLAVNALLVVAGVMTLARKPAGRSLHLLYAVLMIISTFFGTYANMQFQNDYNARMAVYAEENPDSPFAAQADSSMQAVFQLVGMLVSLVISLSWPLFCLIWFLLSKRGRSDMQGTGLEAAA